MTPRGNESDPVLLARLRAHARHGESFALWVGDGWLGLVSACHDAIEGEFPQYELLAVKHRFGELAFQSFPRPWRPTDSAWTLAESSRLDDLTDLYQQRSKATCEWCGQEAKLRESPQYDTTLCDGCEQAKLQAPPAAWGQLFRRP